MPGFKKNSIPLIIDGGMGTELEKAGVTMSSDVWSGLAVLSDPETVRNIHQEFIAAGADVIIANTFAAGRHMLEPSGQGDHVQQINRDAVHLAHEARTNVGRKNVLVAGSICEWTTARQSQWTRPDALSRSVTEQAGLLAESGVDLIALEMCQHPELTRVCMEAALATGLPVWVGMSARRHKGCDDLSVFDHPEIDFEELVKIVAGYPVQVLNVMHTPVTDVDVSLDVLDRYWKGPVGVYPESGYFELPNWQFVDVIEPALLAEQAVGWVGRGVSMLGGCCGLGPDHIKALRQAYPRNPS
jgi:methionine synthase I (cobalamin-dependent)